MKDKPKYWDKHLSTALWAYRTSFKVSTQFTPFHLVYGQEALLPIEVEIPSYKLSLKAGLEPEERWERRLLDLHKLESTREEAVDHYINQAEKRRQKFNELLKDKDLKEGALVLRYDSRLDHRQWITDKTRRSCLGGKELSSSTASTRTEVTNCKTSQGNSTRLELMDGD